MSQVVKFPDMRPPPSPKIAPLPSLSDYRQIKPTLATKDTSTEITPAMRRARRKKLIIWFCVAAGLHTALLLAFFLTPNMRIKWNPPPRDWVPVVSLPKVEPAPPPPPPMIDKPAAPSQAAPPTKSAKHAVKKPKSLPSPQPGDPNEAQRP